MHAAHPEEFRRRAVELARLREKPIAQIAKDLGISESCLRRWIDQADVEEGHKEGLTKDERAELVRLRREKRVLEMEVEILKRASAYFARENISQNRVAASPGACRRRVPRRGGLPGPEGLELRLLQMARPAGLGTGSHRCGVGQHHRRDPH